MIELIEALWKYAPEKVKALYIKWKKNITNYTQVTQSTRNFGWICEDLLVRLNINEDPIVKSTVKERWKEPVVGSEKEPETISLQAEHGKFSFYVCACWRMSQRVICDSVVKVKIYWSPSESELKKRLLLHLDPKPDDLTLNRMKFF